MQSESARATSAAEARFRIQAPNAAARATLVVALDRASLPVLEALAARDWQGAVFFAPSFFEADGGDVRDWFRDIAGRAESFVQEVEATNQAVIVASSGSDVGLASVVGEACAATGTRTCALVLHDPAVTPAAALSATLRRLRPHVSMLSVVSDPEYVEAMLDALRA